MRRAGDRRGVVLMAVLLFVVLMVSGVATFMRRATLDGAIARNRDLGASAEALARGGVELGLALVLEDRLLEERTGLPIESRRDLWAAADGVEMRTEDGGTLRIAVEDAGARLNLNALFSEGEPRDSKTEPLLVALLEKAIAEIPGRAEEKGYDPDALARSLIDWVDSDETGRRGAPEGEPYRDASPPYGPPNRPLLSFDELGLVTGFDAPLLEALRPYVGVFPLAEGGGLNPNTAPSYVLALLYHGTGGDYRMADAERVRRILDIRGEDGILCPPETDGCPGTPVSEVPLETAYPPLRIQSDVFRVTARARYGSVERTAEAVIDRSEVEDPRILEWRVR